MQDVVCVLWGRSGFDRAAQGVLGAARRLADSLGGKLVAISVGPTEPALLNALAAVADQASALDQPALAEYHPELYLKAVAQAAASLKPAAVLLGNDTYSQELAPRLAYRLGGSSAGDAVALTVVDGKVQASRSVYGGKATASIALNRSPAVVWLRARAIAPADATGRTSGAIQPLTIDELAADTRVKVVQRHVEAKEGVRLEDARVIVSGGRGLGGPEPFEQLQALATAMGAQMAASRAACDAGWVPPSWQVGQTGKKVAPELYLAIAISGASQHIMGIADSKVICAINRDPDAPIFKHCRFGIVEDYQKVVGPLRDRLSR